MMLVAFVVRLKARAKKLPAANEKDLARLLAGTA